MTPEYKALLKTYVPEFDEQGPKWFARCCSHGEDTAAQLQKLGRYADAARAWDSASHCALGHGRSERYRDAADRCRKLAVENK